MTEISSKNEYIKLIIVILILLLILGGFLLYVSFPLIGGEEIVLSTMPVDPFDIIRGQYMTIGYEINTIPLNETAKIGDTIYVILEKDENETSRYKELSFVKPNKETFIRGKITSISRQNMRVEYGIEQYFFERNARFERRIENVKVKLSEFGGARIVELLDVNKESIKIIYKNKTITS
ncbi:MAG: GDYXXLXY domain-containing protein [Nanoarchaeota archaeon]